MGYPLTSHPTFQQTVFEHRQKGRSQKPPRLGILGPAAIAFFISAAPLGAIEPIAFEVFHPTRGTFGIACVTLFDRRDDRGDINHDVITRCETQIKCLIRFE